MEIRAFEVVVLFSLAFLWPLLLKIIDWNRHYSVIILFLISLLVSASINSSSDAVFLCVKVFVAVIVFFVVVQSISLFPEICPKAHAWWIFGAAVIAALGISAYFLAMTGFVERALIYSTAFGYRIVSLLPDPNRFADYTGIIASFVAGGIFVERKIRLKSISILMYFLLALILSGSRGAMLSFVAACLIGFVVVVFVAFTPFNKGGVDFSVFKRFFAVFIALSILITAIISTPGGKKVFGRFTGASVKQEDRLESNMRVAAAIVTINNMSEADLTRLVFGVAQYEKVNLGSRQVNHHNTYLSILGAMGFSGLLIFVLLILMFLSGNISVLKKTFSQSGNKMRSLAAGHIFALIFIIFHLLFIDLLHTGYVWIFYGLAASTIAAGKSQQVEEPR
ncbi:MAG TPA: hypothetical protein PLS19_07120 [bacterium]|nr:hypothetical protein [bacterium]